MRHEITHHRDPFTIEQWTLVVSFEPDGTAALRIDCYSRKVRHNRADPFRTVAAYNANLHIHEGKIPQIPGRLYFAALGEMQDRLNAALRQAAAAIPTID